LIRATLVHDAYFEAACEGLGTKLLNCVPDRNAGPTSVRLERGVCKHPSDPDIGDFAPSLLVRQSLY
jgi:hypothetical protein